MSGAQDASVFFRPAPDAPPSEPSLLDRFRRYSPSQGWTALVLLILAMAVVGDSVNAAQWVRGGFSGLVPIMVWGALVGLALSKIRAPWYALIPAGLALGALAVVWHLTNNVEGENFAERFAEAASRLDVWWEAATEGGISADLLPFVTMLLILGWIIGFFSSWFIFRSDNVWVAVILLGTAILTNLSFLPEKFSPRFFLFLFIAMLLIVRVSTVHVERAWERLDIQFSPRVSWLALHATVWFSVIVIAAAAMLPLKVYTNSTAAQVWNIGRAPVATAEDFFARLFAALPSKKDNPGRFFGKWLPFIGEISFGGEAVAWANSDYPSYWLSQTYNYYTPQGWIATETEHIEIGPDILPPSTRDSLKRESEDQTMQMSFESDKFLAGGGFVWVSEPGIVESLAPRKFVIDMDDDSGDIYFPPDVHELADDIRFDMRGLTAQRASALVSGRLPEDLLVVETQADSSDSVESITLQRKAPITPELVAWNFSERIPENEPYRMVSYVSLATNDDLREASTEYDNFITDHYLQLPPSFPESVRDLALGLTDEADNPLDKALMIQAYLRGPEFTYSQSIDAPPPDSDGVEWFLFESKIGYSDYFASSMTVMLRSIGVPARLAAGYSPGELNDLGQRVIRDSDSHGWTQAYFPDYGWIDFEPTPNWPLHDRSPIEIRSLPSIDDPIEEDPDQITDPLDFDPNIEGLETGPAVSSGPTIDIEDFARYLIPVAIAAGAVGGIWILWSAIWNFGLGSLSPEARLYAKMSRLGWLAGVGRRPNQTPIEYGAYVGGAAPDASQEAAVIANSFAVQRYGGREADEEGQEMLLEAWKSIRFKLVGAMFRRLLPQPRDGRSEA